MATAIQFLRSGVPGLRPNPNSVMDGMPMVNTFEGEPGLFFRVDDNSVVKVGPTHVGDYAPNSRPALTLGNSLGEQWFDTTKATAPVFKIWDGTEWVTAGVDYTGLSTNQIPVFTADGKFEGYPELTYTDSTKTFQSSRHNIFGSDCFDTFKVYATADFRCETTFRDFTIFEETSTHKKIVVNEELIVKGDTILGNNDPTSCADTLTVNSTSTINCPSTILADIEITGDVTQTGDYDITGDLDVSGTLTATNAVIGDPNSPCTGTLNVHNDSTFSCNVALDNANKTLTVAGASTFNNTVDVVGNTTVTGTFDVTGNTTVEGTVDVTGNTTVEGTVDVTGNTTVEGTVDVTGNTTVEGTVDVTGNTTVAGTVDITGNTTVAGTVDVTGNTTVAGTVDVTGNTTIEGTVDVTGNTTVAGTVDVTGDTTVIGTVDVTGDTTVTGDFSTTGDVILGTDGQCDTHTITASNKLLAKCDVLVGPIGAPTVEIDASAGDVSLEGTLTAETAVNVGSNNEIVLNGSTGDITTSGGTVTAQYFAGDGSQLTNLNIPGSMTFKGSIDATVDVAPAAVAGDFYLNTGTGTVLASYTGAAGSAIVQDQFIYYTSSSAWEISASTAPYVTLAGAQTITGTKTFSVDQEFSAGVDIAGVLDAAGNTILGTGAGNTLTVNATSTLVAPVSMSSTLGVTGVASCDTATTNNSPDNTLVTKGFLNTLPDFTDGDGATADLRYVKVVGDTMTGLLTLSGAPTADLHAATKKYVDDQSFWSRDENNGFLYPAALTDKVGIGTASPGRELHVKGANNVIRAESTGTAARIEFKDSTSTGTDKVALGSVTDDMQLIAGGSERARITSTGNVGIGTNNPQASLHIKSSGSAKTNVTLENSTTSKQKLVAGLTGTNNLGFSIYDDLLSETTFRIDNTGNVGIGTDSPERKLHIVKGGSTAYPLDGNAVVVAANNNHSIIQLSSPNTDSCRINFGDSEAYSPGRITYDHSSNNLVVNVNGAEAARILANGNVGIGLNNPANKFQVKGTGDATNTAVSVSEFTASIRTDNAHLNIGSVDGKPCLQGSGSGTAYHMLLNPLNGNVGIGVDGSPATKLHVYGASGDITSTVQSGSTVGRFLTNATGTYVGTTTNNDFTIQTNSVGRVTVKNTGNVGIGTNAPNRTLHVNSTASNPVRIESSQPDSRIEFKSLNSASHDTVSIGSAGNDFQINTNTAGGGVRRVTVKADGNVGIGKTDPAVKLDINGKARSNSTVAADPGTTLVTKDYLSSAGSGGSGAFGYWTRSGTNLSPKNSGDSITDIGNITSKAACTISTAVGALNLASANNSVTIKPGGTGNVEVGVWNSGVANNIIFRSGQSTNQGYLFFENTNTYSGRLSFGGITSNRKYQFQDKAGTIAHLDDINPLNVSGGDGIAITDGTDAGEKVIAADLASNKGLEFQTAKLAVKLGAGLEFDATGAIQTNIDSLTFKGDVDATTSSTRPSSASVGDVFVNNGGGTISTEWGARLGNASAGDACNIGDLIVCKVAATSQTTGTYTYVPTGGVGTPEVWTRDSSTSTLKPSTSGDKLADIGNITSKAALVIQTTGSNKLTLKANGTSDVEIGKWAASSDNHVIFRSGAASNAQYWFYNENNTFRGQFKFMSSLSNGGLTANRTYTWPNKTGTVALTSDTYWDRSNGNVYLSTSSDKVGIGTNSPYATLDVSGTFQCSSTATVSALYSPVVECSGSAITGNNDVASHGFLTAIRPAKDGTVSPAPQAGFSIGRYGAGVDNKTQISLTLVRTGGSDPVWNWKDTGELEVPGDIVPATDGVGNLGSSTKRFNNVYTQDMHFSNEGTEGNSIDGTTGDWTLQEGHDHLYFINNKTGMKFRVVMEAV